MRMFWQSLSRLWKGSTRTRRSPLIQPRRRPLRLEWLEQREVPANVVANQVGTTLFLTGNNSAILADNDQEFSIIGFGQDAVTVQGLNVTTVNFGAGPIDYV